MIFEEKETLSKQLTDYEKSSKKIKED